LPGGGGCGELFPTIVQTTTARKLAECISKGISANGEECNQRPWWVEKSFCEHFCIPLQGSGPAPLQAFDAKVFAIRALSPEIEKIPTNDLELDGYYLSCFAKCRYILLLGTSASRSHFCFPVTPPLLSNLSLSNLSALCHLSFLSCLSFLMPITDRSSDDAASRDQVLPLLPRSDCIVIVTSHRHLALHLEFESVIEVKLKELSLEVRIFFSIRPLVQALPLAPAHI
jgi:hypothetical protein